MHDKADTKTRLQHVLSHTDIPVELHFYYPMTHFAGREVPEAVSSILEPLDIHEAATMDGFIITGSPIETLEFDQVHYIAEVRTLLKTLGQHVPNQMYLCWGGMVALNYFFGVSKLILPHKLFGVYPQTILEPHPFLKGLKEGFKSPHARYAEMDVRDIRNDPRLTINATTTKGKLFMVTEPTDTQTFIFSHIEYDRWGLDSEYKREVAAHPEISYKRAKHYYHHKNDYDHPKFNWKKTQRTIFDNWVRHIADHRNENRSPII